MNKEEMMNNIVRKFGFEDIHTIIFFGLCDNSNVSDNTLWETYDEYMNYSVFEDDEEE